MGKVEITKKPLDKLLVDSDEISFNTECSYVKGKFFQDQIAG